MQWTLKTCCILCWMLLPASSDVLFAASCRKHIRRWVTRRCQERQRYDLSESDEYDKEAEEDSPVWTLLMEWQVAKTVIL